MDNSMNFHGGFLFIPVTYCPIQRRMVQFADAYILPQFTTPAIEHYEITRFMTPYLIAPSSSEFAGTFNFNMLLQRGGVAPDYLYSARLLKMFVRRHGILELGVDWTPNNTDEMYLRVTAILDTDPFGPYIYDVRGGIPNARPGSIYENHGSYSSVLTPLGRTEILTGATTMEIKLSPNAIRIIVTLEYPGGQVLGRRTMAVRVTPNPWKQRAREERVRRRR